ncbi:MAG: acetylglutamate kinase [Desulfobulbaceae bacterium]|nr:acetylglutamate kinase [Desulfobulbaceae bacterium]
MKKGIEKAEILIESLPYIKEFYNKTMVIKYGGHAMIDDDLKKDFALDIILMKYIGINPVVVHGGGPQINELLKKLNIRSNYIQGIRITDRETMNVVEMVLVGKVNKEIVGLINYHGGKAVGLSGRDGDLIKAKKLTLLKNQARDMPPEIIDLGRVGEVTQVNPEILVTLDTQGFIPVIAPVGVGEDGRAYNINADLVAGAVASHLNAAKLILLTDVEGVLDRDNRLIASMTSKKADQLIESETITGGMIPKIRCCQEALAGEYSNNPDNRVAGVTKAHIIDGRIKHAILLEMFTRQGIGTEILSS